MSSEKAVEARPIDLRDRSPYLLMRMITMREIKFRLFGKNSKEFLRPENAGLNLKELQNICDIDLWHVMQFTGLTDKNGVEIYEGDILSTDLSRPYLVIEFRGGAFMYQCHDSGYSYYDFMSSSDDPITKNEYCAVIGNIHQNPELLEQNDE